MSEVPVYLFDVDLAFLAPDPVEPPSALNTTLDMLSFQDADALNMKDFFGSED